MEKIDIGFINKTSIIPNKELVGYGHRIKRNPFELKQSVQENILNEYNKFLKNDKDDLSKSDPRKVVKLFRQGSKIMRWDLDLNYRYIFDYKTGRSVRSEYLDDAGNQTGKDVFAANFPHLIDVGIMGHCTHGQSGLCLLSGVQCYQDGLNINKPNMSVEDFRRIASECKDLTNQFALGGRGDPNEHEHFEEILKICKENHIVPNYTTSGFGLTDKHIELTKKYCGAVAVSWYRSTYTLDAISRFIDAGVKTNIHYVLNKDTIFEAIDRLENNKFPKGINAIVFLSHKPVGLGEKNKCLSLNDALMHKMFELIRKGGYGFKIGVDGSLVVGIINSGLSFDMRYLDTCEAARFTCYIDADLLMHPCSFDVTDKYTVDLHSCSIVEAWNSDVFNEIRMILKTGCKDCEHSKDCMGGCFLHRDIVLCNNKK